MHQLTRALAVGLLLTSCSAGDPAASRLKGFNSQVSEGNDLAEAITVGIGGAGSRGHCSGVVLTPRHVLTAAHCVGPADEGLWVAQGINLATFEGKFEEDQNGVVFSEVEKRWIHPSYTTVRTDLYTELQLIEQKIAALENGLEKAKYEKKLASLKAKYEKVRDLPSNDLAILTLNQPFKAAKPISLIEGVDHWRAKAEFFYFGYGIFEYYRVFGRLQYTKALSPTLNQKTQQIEFGATADHSPRAHAACSGDSGGPLVMIKPGKARYQDLTVEDMVLVGIAETANCSKDFSAYTFLPPYLSLIRDQIKQ